MVVSKSSGMARFDYSGIASGATLGTSSEGSSTNTINTQKSNTTKRKKRRHRTIFTQFQIDELEKAFQVSNIPHFSYDPSQKRLRCWSEGEWGVDISANTQLMITHTTLRAIPKQKKSRSRYSSHCSTTWNAFAPQKMDRAKEDEDFFHWPIKKWTKYFPWF